MTEPKRYLVTSALPYANGLKHIGHLAGAYVPADIYVRYLRAQKRDVVFVCGSDEHGAAITIQAMKEGTTPRAIVDKYHEILKQNFVDFSISFDVYHRTSSPLHHETAQEFFTALNSKGDLEVKESEQYFDEAAQTFLADRFIIGTCPVCSNPNAFGDQCERCGSTLSPEQLINPRSTLSGNQPIKKWTKHWYLPLDRHEDFLRKWILEDHKGDWKTNVLGQCKSWIDAGLQPRAVTRDLDWGVQVPASPTPPKEGLLTPKEYDLKSGTDDSETLLLEEDDKYYGYQTADPTQYAALKDYVREHRSRPTEGEIALWEMLRDKRLGYKFRRQHIIGNFIADFICLSEKLIVEVDGSIHQLPENKLSDEERTLELNKFGFEVIRFLNSEVLQQPDKVLFTIKQKLQETSTTLPKEELRPEADLSSLQGISHKVKLDSEALQSVLSPSFGGVGEAGKVLYVWFDAPIGYISATKQWALDTGKDWQPYWQDKDTKLVHFVGKDNIVFHCIIFPVMLQLHGNILPDNVPANEFMNLEGDKMSTSRGWSIEMDEYITDWIKPENGGPQMADVLRYYLTAISPETKDSEFTWKGFQNANNSELASIFGNFVNRTMVLMHKLTKGKVPTLHTAILDGEDRKLMAEIEASKAKIEGLLESYKFREALFEVINLSRIGNGYLQKKEPWKVVLRVNENGQPTTEAQQSIDVTLHLCLQLCANLAILINPFLPNTATKICYMLKVVDKMLDWENAGKLKLLSTGYSLREPQLLFRKIENTEIEAQIQKLQEKASPTPPKEGLLSVQSPFINQPAMNTTNSNSEAKQPDLSPSVGGVGEAVKPEIQFDDFAKIDLKVGTITAAEKVQKADKLLKLSVDLGFETRTIVSGIALHFTPEEIVGKQVTVVTNLAPRKMRGIESQGMILMAEDASGKLHFINPETAITAGAGVS